MKILIYLLATVLLCGCIKNVSVVNSGISYVGALYDMELRKKYLADGTIDKPHNFYNFRGTTGELSEFIGTYKEKVKKLVMSRVEELNICPSDYFIPEDSIMESVYGRFQTLIGCEIVGEDFYKEYYLRHFEY